MYQIILSAYSVIIRKLIEQNNLSFMQDSAFHSSFMEFNKPYDAMLRKAQ